MDLVKHGDQSVAKDNESVEGMKVEVDCSVGRGWMGKSGTASSAWMGLVVHCMTEPTLLIWLFVTPTASDDD